MNTGRIHAPGIGASVALALVMSMTAESAHAENPELSFVLDGFFKSEDSALSEQGKGFGLGHTELSLSGAVDDLFSGRLTTVLESHEGDTELDIEEAFFDTVALPYGLGIRAGRFLSQVGYLNSRHTHADSFTERPALYRAFLGSHYFDDGVRLAGLMPVPFFWQLGVEAFNGTALAGGEADPAIGVFTLKSTWGGDLSDASSWQAGVSYLRNRLDAVQEVVEEDADEDGHDHSHDAAYSGENMYLLDFVWKWAPQGNARNSQLTLSGEYLYVDELGDFAQDSDVHKGWYASSVYRFHSQWSAGIRYGEVNLKAAHGDHFHDQSLRETEVMLGWMRSHFSQLRLQYTLQDAEGFEDANDTLSLQYVMTLGAHGAHEF
ncbi:hypothetical protein [Granulosicoccus antarcticus]|uniref:Porin domain-containing protein n=1 Tax=Granulosicoccus antarcticus IMCC3135 TaxID=1192854 RepID=A0A2Z2NSD0_9GAMM|nr:hypothetical protein [Granulosicoccus antarcticus]ASJ74402.1 hypothetical protein IMCC3135_21625 [Granulosicoccus antarcticus IMCC3135]